MSRDVVARVQAALESYREKRAADEVAGEGVNTGNLAGDALAELVAELVAEVERLRAQLDRAARGGAAL